MKNTVYLLMFLLLTLTACSEKELTPISKSLGKPGVVTNVEQEAIPGGVRLTYLIPQTEDILAVKAVYTLSNGKTYESVSSYYENSLRVEGFNDLNEHELKLYTVNRAQEISDPVTVKFAPLESPLSKVIKTVNIVSDFGGANFSWMNVDKAPITFELLAQDSIGQMRTMNVVTSEMETANRTIRGYASVPWRFATIVSDNFGNMSDSIFPPSILTPLFEERLNKTKMSVMKLSNDANYTNWEGMDYYLIDDDKTTFGHSPSNSLPAPFTIDLGVKARLSRLVLHNRHFNDSYYSWGNPKKVTVYVCFHTPSSSGDWDEWTKISDYEEVKPSGLSGTTMSDEDLTYAEAGFEYLFPIEMEAVRYIRVTVLETWEGTTFTHPAEIDVYGETVNE
ncbi:MAG: DUF4959 domain-containing protein [Tannerella sp.]|jgi:hypothetical protein|nr:DUF4959 domain-containing protein [Tannerella sp.]